MKALSFLVILFMSIVIGAQAQTGNQALLQIFPYTTLSDCSSTTDVRTVTGGGLVAGQPATAFVAVQSGPQPVICQQTIPPPNTPPYSLVNSAGPGNNNQVSVLAAALLNATPACTSPTAGTAYICLYQGGNYVTKAVFQFDTRPNEITLDKINVGNHRISFDINDPKGTNPNGYQICYSTNQTNVDALLGQTTCGNATSYTSTTTHVDLKGLTNDKPCFFNVRVNSADLHQSPWASQTALQETPIETDGFAELYNGVPNPISFGCSQTSKAPATWSLFAALALLLALRSRRYRLFLALTLITGSAFADLGQINFGIIGTPYKPALDSSTKSDGSKTYPFYRCMFSDKLLPLMGVEVDVHLLDEFGSLQLGMAAAYTYVSGHALKAPGGNPQCGNFSADTTGLHQIHLRPQLTYILDRWLDTVPLAPYVRGGPVAVGYLFTYHDGLDKENPTNKPMGIIFGFEAALGLMFALDFLEPGVAKNARANGVYEHVYLKAEAAYSPINNFSNGLNFSSLWPTDSFPLMLNFGLVFEFQ